VFRQQEGIACYRLLHAVADKLMVEKVNSRRGSNNIALQYLDLLPEYVIIQRAFITHDEDDNRCLHYPDECSFPSSWTIRLYVLLDYADLKKLDVRSR